MAKLTAKKLKKVYKPDDDDGAWVEIIYLKKGVRNMIDSMSNEISASGESGEMETRIEFNTLKKRKLFFENAINDWGGFFTLKGKPAKCNMTTILAFDKELGDLYTWLVDEMDTFIEEVEAELEKELEN